jgi:hypothetical protein
MPWVIWEDGGVAPHILKLCTDDDRFLTSAATVRRTAFWHCLDVLESRYGCERKDSISDYGTFLEDFLSEIDFYKPQTKSLNSDNMPK